MSNALSFKRATKHAAKLRLAFIGPAGSGKTYSSLSVASSLGGRVAVIDTERGSASKYADRFEFDVLELESFAPDIYVQAISAAEREGYDVIVVDSLSHAWMGKGGALEQVDDHARREKGNSFGAWRHVTPKHNAMVDALVSCRSHLIVTMRSKTEWVIEEERGKKVPKKIGMAPIQRDGLEFEFDVVGDMDQQNSLVITKSRCPDLSGKVVEKPGAQLAATLRAWLGGVARPPALKSEPMDGSDLDLLARLSASIQIAAGKGMEALEELAQQLKSLPNGPTRDRLSNLYRDAWKATKAQAEAERARSTAEFAAQHASPSPPANGNGSGRGRPAAGQTSQTTNHASNGGSAQPPARGAATASPSASVAAPLGDIALSPEQEAAMVELEMTAAALRENPGWLDSFEGFLARVPECSRKAAARSLYEDAKRARDLEIDEAELAAVREERAWESMT